MSDTDNKLENMTVVPTDGALGAEILGLDLSKPVPKATVAAIRGAFLEHCLVVFRDQNLDEPDQVRFTRYFGEPVVHVRKQADRTNNEIMMVSNVKKNGKPIGALGHQEIEFHSDLSYMPKPGTISMLYAVEIPDTGGATQWCNLYKAYAGLDEACKQGLAGLRATHRHFNAEQNPSDITDHPIVCTHPETGRKTLFVSPLFCKTVIGLDAANGRERLAGLFEHALQTKYVWTHNWQIGDLVMWDNRATMHRREPFPDTQRRIMKRTQVFNDTVPVA